jgi:carbamoyltransferase
VDSGQQPQLADLVGDHLASLEQALDDLVQRGEPLSAFEAALILDAAAGRLRPVEKALREGPGKRFVPRTVDALRRWLSPRIGLLRHYPPKPIALPSTYFKRGPTNHGAPSISIVTPSFQQGLFLERTICSVLSQQYSSLEYFVHDGGSTDNSVSILDRYTARLAGWESEPDEGQADAINRAFSQTQGEVMGWLNSDDLLLPSALETVGRYFARHPEVDVLYGNRLMIDEHDSQIGAWILPAHDDFVLTIADYVPQETLFWRRRIWERVGARVDPAFRYALDWDLLLRFRREGARMKHIGRFLGAFRVHEAQKTSAYLPVGLVEMQLLRAREHGRELSLDEVLQSLQPYFRRHRIVHAWYRALDRLPLPRQVFRPVPSMTSLESASAHVAATGLASLGKAHHSDDTPE